MKYKSLWWCKAVNTFGVFQGRNYCPVIAARSQTQLLKSPVWVTSGNRVFWETAEPGSTIFNRRAAKCLLWKNSSFKCDLYVHTTAPVSHFLHELVLTGQGSIRTGIPKGISRHCRNAPKWKLPSCIKFPFSMHDYFSRSAHMISLWFRNLNILFPDIRTSDTSKGTK